MADGFQSGARIVCASMARACRPPPDLLVSEHAAEYRYVPDGPNPGRWQNEETPYLVRPMDRLSVSDPCRRVSIRGSAQIGKTEVGINWVFYLSEMDPARVYIGLQSDDKVTEFNNEKLDPSIEASPHIRRFILAQEERTAKGSTTRVKRFRSGRAVKLISMRSSSALQSATIKYVLGDELAEWDMDVEGRGDPVDQLETRQTAMEEAGAKSCYISTPGIKGACLISEQFEKGDQCFPYLECPECGSFHVLDFDNMRAPEGNHGAHFIAPCCGSVLEHRHKRQMVLSLLTYDSWVPCFESENPENPAPPKVIEPQDLERWKARDTEGREPSFQIWQAYSGFVSWDRLWQKWQDAQDRPLKLKTFTQQVLGMPFEEARDVPDTELLMALREDYAPGRVPVGAYLLTAGVDVQADRLEYDVMGWGPGGSGWHIETGVIPGDPESPEVWAKLQQRCVNAKFEGPQGQLVGVAAVAVDSGYLAHVVYKFARANPTVVVIKGDQGAPNAPILSSAREVKAANVKAMLRHVGTFPGKSLLYQSLKLTLAGRDSGTGLWRMGALHFHMGCDEAFFEQLTAEYLKDEVDKRGRSRSVWVKPSGKRNERMDCVVYARAVAEGMEKGGLSSWSYPGPVWDKIISDFGGLADGAQMDLAQHWAGIGASGAAPEKPAAATPRKAGKISLKRNRD